MTSKRLRTGPPADIRLVSQSYREAQRGLVVHSLLISIMYTRSGNRVVHMEASYGRAARKESKRRRLKRKMITSTEEDQDCTAKSYDSTGEEAADKSTEFTPARRTTRAQLQI